MPRSARRLRDRDYIHCDLHMHTDHSPDCATPAELLLETAKEQGLGAIAITDHNEISGALEAREIAKRIGGIKVIVAEEVKTAHQGEVIGLFLRSGSSAECRWPRRSRRSVGREALSTSRIRSTACIRCPTTSICWRWSRRSTSSRSSTRGWRSRPSTRRPCASPASTRSSPEPDRTATSRRDWAASRSACGTSTTHRSSSSRCEKRRSSASTRTSSTSRRSNSCRQRRTRRALPGGT